MRVPAPPPSASRPRGLLFRGTSIGRQRRTGGGECVRKFARPRVRSGRFGRPTGGTFEAKNSTPTVDTGAQSPGEDDVAFRHRMHRQRGGRKSGLLFLDRCQRVHAITKSVSFRLSTQKLFCLCVA
jgi:hypothetical protein